MSRKWKENFWEKRLLMNVSSNSRHSAKDMLKPVNFYCAAPHAQSVEIAGDFNQWKPSPMRPLVDGWWFAQVPLSHGHHQYRFLVDGRPILDPHATGMTRDERNEQASLIAVS